MTYWSRCGTVREMVPGGYMYIALRTLNGSAKLIWLLTCEVIVINALAVSVLLCFEMRKCAIIQ